MHHDAVGSLRSPPQLPQQKLIRLALRASDHFPVREQPQDDAESDQAHEAVRSQILDQSHDVGGYAAEEGEVRTNKNRSHDRKCQQH